MNKYSVAIAAFIICILRFAIFIEPKETCTGNYIGSLPAMIVVLSTCIILTDLQFPERYRKYPQVFFFIETLTSILAVEFVLIWVWARIEEKIVLLIKFLLGHGNLYEEMGGDSFLGFMMTACTMTFLLYAIKATKSTDSIVRGILSIKEDCSMLIEKFKRFKSGAAAPAAAGSAHCHIPCQVVYMAAPQPAPRRNPQCPIHGDLELTRRMK